MHKSLLREDTRNKSENDWCRGRGFSLVARKQRSVAVGNKVMDTRLPQPVGCGDKYDVSDWCWGSMFGAFCMLFKYPSPAGKPATSPARGEDWHRPWCHKILGTDCASRPSMTGGRGANSFGRSMIEMLGVLAIIGVLSVGGIAGYSKAMEKWKINKMQEEYSYLLHGMLEHLDNLKYLNPTSETVGVVDVLQASGIIPPTWEKFDDFRIWDDNGNLLALFSRNNELGFSVNIGGYHKNDDGKNISEGFNKQTCLTLFKDLFYPLHSEALRVWLHHNPTTEIFAGDKYCSADVQCLRDATLAKMKAACDVCDGKTNCDISVGF